MPKNAYPLRNRLDGVIEVKALDKATLQITTAGPAPNLLANLADYNMIIMPRHLHDRGDDLSKVAIGTGPKKIKSYDRCAGARAQPDPASLSINAAGVAVVWKVFPPPIGGAC